MSKKIYITWYNQDFSLCYIRTRSTGTIWKDNCVAVFQCFMWLLQIAQNRYEKKSVNKSESKRALVTIFEHM